MKGLELEKCSREEVLNEYKCLREKTELWDPSRLDSSNVKVWLANKMLSDWLKKESLSEYGQGSFIESQKLDVMHRSVELLIEAGFKNQWFLESAIEELVLDKEKLFIFIDEKRNLIKDYSEQTAVIILIGKINRQIKEIERML